MVFFSSGEDMKKALFFIGMCLVVVSDSAVGAESDADSDRGSCASFWDPSFVQPSCTCFASVLRNSEVAHQITILIGAVGEYIQYEREGAPHRNLCKHADRIIMVINGVKDFCNKKCRAMQELVGEDRAKRYLNAFSLFVKTVCAFVSESNRVTKVDLLCEFAEYLMSEYVKCPCGNSKESCRRVEALFVIVGNWGTPYLGPASARPSRIEVRAVTTE